MKRTNFIFTFDESIVWYHSAQSMLLSPQKPILPLLCSRVWPTMTQGPNLAHHLVLYSPRVKSVFCITKCLFWDLYHPWFCLLVQTTLVRTHTQFILWPFTEKVCWPCTIYKCTVLYELSHWRQLCRWHQVCDYNERYGPEHSHVSLLLSKHWVPLCRNPRWQAIVQLL